MYTLVKDNDGYGRVYYETPCGNKLVVAEIYSGNKSGLGEPPSIVFKERGNFIHSINKIMALVNESI